VEVLREPLVAVEARDHPLAGPGPVDLAALAVHPLLLTPRSLNSGVHDAVLDCFHRAGVTPRLGAALLNEMDGLTHVAASDSWTLLSTGAAGAAGAAVALLPLAGDPPYASVTLAWSARRATPAVTDFVDAALAAGPPRAAPRTSGA
jgi:hypothetical protein